MLNLRFQGGANEGDVAEFERSNSICLPQDYRNFIIEKNGGRILCGGVFREKSTQAKLSRLDRLLGLSSIDHESLARNLSDLVDRIPPEFLPIAYDGGGNWLLLDCSRELTGGGVYFLDLERADDSNPPQREQLPLVASSFSELMKLLSEE
jgi:hypothetical protein